MREQSLATSWACGVGRCDHPVSADDASGFKMRCGQGPDGKPAALVYLSEDSVKAIGDGEIDVLVGPAQAVFGSALQGGATWVIVDSHGPGRLILNEGMVRALAEGRVPGGEGEEVEVKAQPVPHRVEKATDPPAAEVTDSVRAALVLTEGVRAGWWLRLVNDVEQARTGLGLLIEVSGEGEHAAELPAELGAALAPIATGDGQVQLKVFAVTPDQAPKALADITEQLVPWNRSPLRKFASNRRRCQGAATQAGPCPPPRRRNAGSGVEGRKLV